MNWQIISASVTGKGHLQRDVPCQDAHIWEILPQNTLVVAVADGAGSAQCSEVGAQIAVKIAMEVISEKLTFCLTETEMETVWKDYSITALQAAQDAITAEAEAQEIEVRELATTLILVVATPQWVGVTQVGDGAAVVKTVEETLEALTVPEQGEYLNETKFLIHADAVETAQVHLWQGQATHLAVFSDGLQMLGLKMPDGTPHQPFFTPLFQFVAAAEDEISAKEQLVSFLRSPKVTERTDDDLTLVLAALCD